MVANKPTGMNSIPSPTDAVVAVTYECDARCVMCNIWKNPPSEVVPPEVFGKLPPSLKTINLSGGEPFLREDLPEIVHQVKSACPSSQIIISTNSLNSQRIGLMLPEIVKRDPGIGLGISVDGIGKMHDAMRGTKGAFDKAMHTLELAKKEGVRNIRLAFTATSRNISHLGDVLELSREKEVEFTCAVAQNSEHYFKTDANQGIDDFDELKKQFDRLISTQLRGFRPKRWARAYFARGVYEFATHKHRLLECRAGGDFFFLDPTGAVYSCNVLPAVMGNLAETDFAALWSSPQAHAVREKVARCQEGCWMICTARTVIKQHPFSVGSWILRSKALRALGKRKFLS
jgi:radical SAM protein with 4Fe4S-binding SPASM domain